LLPVFDRDGAIVRKTMNDRFAESIDVLKTPRRQQSVVHVLDIEIGGGTFVTMAGL
jgi:hypothetical protein